MKDLNISLLQYDIEWESAHDNYNIVERALNTLPANTDLVILPEAFTTGFSNYLAMLAEPAEGDTLSFVQQLSHQHDAMIAASWIVRDEGCCYNRLHLVRPDGTYCSYDKAHTFRLSSEVSQIERGNRHSIVEWRGWRIMPSVCYDLRFPTWLRNHYNNKKTSMDYDLLLCVANWPMARRHAWKTLLAARAIENLSFVAGVNRCGVDGLDITYSGDSMVLDFKGLPMAFASDDQAQIISTTLVASELQDFRRKNPFYLDFDE